MRFTTALGIVTAPIVLLIGNLWFDDWQDDRFREANQGNFAAFCGVGRLADAVREFRAVHGELPAQLDAIATSPGCVAIGYVRCQSLIDPWGHAYRYELIEGADGFRVFTLGRDNEVGGELANEDQSAP
jgi:hypothetical protein